jgi:hypothetical protein
MNQNNPQPAAFRIARRGEMTQNLSIEAPEPGTHQDTSRRTAAKSDRYCHGPRKTSHGGSGRFISRLVSTIAKLRRHIKHVERQASIVADAAKKRTDGATRMVMEQRAAADARSARQSADINKRSAQRSEVRRVLLHFASGDASAIDALREVNRVLELNIPELE